MNGKLTLRLDQALINVAKVEARQRGKSLSQIVADYFRALSKSRPKSFSGNKKPLPPMTAALTGSLRSAKFDEQDYRRYLEKKYT